MEILSMFNFINILFGEKQKPDRESSLISFNEGPIKKGGVNKLSPGKRPPPPKGQGS